MAISEQSRARSNALAKRMIQLESAKPGLIQLAHNPHLKPIVLKKFKHFGFAKPFLKSYHDFVFSSLFENSDLLGVTLPFCLFIGPDNLKEGNGVKDCWDGIGVYRGYQGILRLFDFSMEDKNDVIMVIDIQPFFADICDLLDPIRDMG